MTIILAIIALFSAIWAFVQTRAKGLLSRLIDELNLNVTNLKGDLAQTHALLREEKNALMRERIKSSELQEKVAMLTQPAQDLAVKSMEVVEAPKSIDIAALVDGAEAFQMGENERTVFFEFYKDRHAPKEIRWRLKAKNNKVLADSGEGYGTKQNLKKALGVMISAIMNGELKSKWKA